MRWVVVALLALVVYLNILPNGFLIDDPVMIVHNRLLRDPQGLKKIFTSNAWASLSQDIPINYYRPLMHTTLYASWRIFHDEPAGYHLLSILLHLAASVTVLLCLRRLQPSETVAWLAALLFAVHPIHTEAVDWISAFPDVQSAFFVLLGLWLYLCGEDAQGWKRDALGAGAALSSLLALFAKETGLVLPAMIVLYELAWRRRNPLEVLRQRTLALVGIAGACLVYLGLRWYVLGGIFMPVPSHFPGSRSQILTGWSAIFYEYVKRIVFPLKLSSYFVVCGDGHPCPTLGSFRTLAGLLLAVLILISMLWLYRRRRPEWMAIALFILALAPSFLASLRDTGIWPGERYLYLASVGFCWLAAVALQQLRRPPAAGLLVILVVLSLYSVRTILRNRDWREESSFFRNELRVEGESRHVRNLLVDYYLIRGRPVDAIEQAQVAMGFAPGDARLHNSLGLAYWEVGRREEALAEYHLAADEARNENKPRLAARALNNVAVAYSSAGQTELAIPRYRAAVALDPKFAEAQNNLGLALLETGRLDEAMAQFRLAIRLSPELASAHTNLGFALAARHQVPEARAEWQEALRLEPNDARAQAGLRSLEER